MSENSIYITTPIYYVNDVPHIGHAYTTLIADFMTRFMRLDGNSVKFLTGTDEYGQKVAKSALKANVPTQEFTDKTSQVFRDLAKKMNYKYDDFIRTTEDRHKVAVEALWNRLIERNQIYLGSYSGWYSVRDEAFYQEKELINGKAPTGADVEWIEESSYFFKLSQWQDKLLELYDKQLDFIFPNERRNEVLSFVKSGLKDLSVSRKTSTWGISVPQNKEHTVYVWVDALTNYLTGVGFPNLQNSGEYKKYWDDGNSNITHIVGKDIVRFHAVYWPALLMAADLPLPKHILAHGWWTNEGEKISKSLGNVINPFELLEKFGVDQLRYFLIKEIPFGKDGNFSQTSFINCINADLANNIGNLVQRTVSFIHKECEGKVPKVDIDLFTAEHALPEYRNILDIMRQYVLKYEFNAAISVIVDLSSEANRYIDNSAPWQLKKEDRNLMKAVLYKLLEYIRVIGILLQTIVPDSAKKILDQLVIPEKYRQFSYIDTFIKEGTVLPLPQPIFSRFEL